MVSLNTRNNACFHIKRKRITKCIKKQQTTFKTFLIHGDNSKFMQRQTLTFSRATMFSQCRQVFPERYSNQTPNIRQSNQGNKKSSENQNKRKQSKEKEDRENRNLQLRI